MPSWIRRPSILIRSLPTYRGHGLMVCTALLWAAALPTPGVILSRRAKYSSSADAPRAPTSSSDAKAILIMTHALFVVAMSLDPFRNYRCSPRTLHLEDMTVLCP